MINIGISINSKTKTKKYNISESFWVFKGKPLLYFNKLICINRTVAIDNNKL